MTVKQKRTLAYVLACSAIMASMVLWAQVVRSRLAADVSVEPAQISTLHPSADLERGGSSSSSLAEVSVLNAVPPRTAPLIPSLHFAASSLSRSSIVEQSPLDEELKQWEIREAFALSIPSLSVRAPVLLPSLRFWNARAWDQLERQMQVGLFSGLVAYPHSVAPGRLGTVIIAGHSSPPTDRAKESRYGQIFSRLPELLPHDQIVLRTGTDSFTYEVIDTKVISAGDTTILSQQKQDALLTVITCYPVGSTRERFVVIAKKVEGTL